MLWKERLFAALLAVGVTAALTVALLRFGPDRASHIPTPEEGGLTRAAAGIDPGAAVMIVDGNEAPAELLTYQIGYSCAYLEYQLQMNGGGDFDPEGRMPDGEPVADYVMSESLLMLKQQLVLENMAERYGIGLSEEDEAELAAQRQAFVDELGEDGYRTELWKLGVSEAGFDRLSRVDYLYSALYDAWSTPGSPLYADDASLRAYAEEHGYITADHILIPTVDLDTRERLDDKAVERNRAQAEELLRQLRQSSDPAALFGELADRYSQDRGRASKPEGYTFAPGTMVSEFDEAARALGEGEIGDIVESQYGYHIILRKPLAVASAADEVRDAYFDDFFDREVEGAHEELTSAAGRFDVARVWEAFTAANARG